MVPPSGPAAPAGPSASAGLACSILAALPGTSHLLLDPDLRLVAAGGAALLGPDEGPSSVVGRLLGEVVPATVFAALAPHCAAALAGLTACCDATSPDGTLVYECDIAPWPAPDGTVVGAVVVARDVTAARRAQAALAARERELSELVETSADLVVRCTLDDVVTYASAASRRLLGLEPEELVGRRILDLLLPTDRRALEARRERLHARPAGTRMEGRFLRADGSIMWGEATARPILDPTTGEPVGTQATVRDITERRVAERALRTAERRQRLLLANLPDTVILKAGRDLVCRHISGGALASAGRPAEELVGLPLPELLAPLGAQAADVLAANAEALAGGRPRLALRSEATGQHYDLRILALPGEGEEVAGTMFIATNVTEKRAREDDVARLARVVAATGEAVISASQAGTIDAVNRSACELFGYEEAELLGRNISDLVAPEAGDVLTEARRAVLQDRVWRAEYDQLAKGGRRFPATVTVSPVHDEAGALIGGAVLVRDVSAEREAQQRLEEANQRFAQTIANAPIGMALVDLDGGWLEVNRALCEIVGYDRSTLLQRTFQDITHPDDLDADLALLDELLAGKRASYELEKRYVRADGTTAWVLLTVSAVRDGAGVPLHLISQLLDIGDRKRDEFRLRRAADSDALTGVLSRKRFTEVLTDAIGATQRGSRTSALLFLDLDGFKAVNDTLGHATGDDVLTAVAHRLTRRLRAGDAVGRHGGDEFVVLLDGIDEARARQVADQLLELVRGIPVPGADGTLGVDASIGIAMLDGGVIASAEAAFAAADRAMYAVKTRRRRAAAVAG